MSEGRAPQAEGTASAKALSSSVSEAWQGDHGGRLRAGWVGVERARREFWGQGSWDLGFG